MGILSKYNKGGNVNFDIDLKGFEFCKLKDLYSVDGDGVCYDINGMYIHRGKINVHPVVINVAMQKQIDLPEHLTEQVRDMLADPEVVNLIKQGGAQFVIYEYDARNKKCYSVRFIDK